MQSRFLEEVLRGTPHYCVTVSRMKLKSWLLLLLLLACSAPQAAIAQVVPIWQEAVTPDGKASQKLIQSDPRLANIVAYMNRTYRFPRRLPVVYQEAGKINAWYSGGTHQITVSYDLVTFLRKYFRLKKVSNPDEAARQTLAFILLHEFGHAIIHELGLPAVGREEDAADEFATLVAGPAMGDGGQQAAFAAANWFALMGRSKIDLQKMAFWDEHSLNTQRFYKILCLLYGADPRSTANIVRPVVPYTRLMTASKRFPARKANWNRLLSRHKVGAQAQTLNPVLPDPREPRQISFEAEQTGGGLQPVSELLRTQQFTSLVQWLNQKFTPPKHLYARYISTDVPKNFFLPMTGQLILSKQFFGSADKKLSALTVQQRNETLRALETFSLLQEFSRGLIHDAQLPITGEPEDAAAELAMMLILENPHYRKLAVPMSRWYDALGKDTENVLQLKYWSESALDQQRFYDLMGYLYIVDPQTYPQAKSLFDAKRLQKMAFEYRWKKWAWSTLLKPFASSL